MAEPTLPIIDIRNVSKSFKLQGQSIDALKDANLSIRQGEFVTLIGASGCGKSTLLRIIAGFEKPTSGEALMWGKPITEPEPQRGMVFQDYALFPWLSVRDNIAFGPTSRGVPKAEARETVERWTGRALVVRRVLEKRQCWSARGDGRARLALAPVGDVHAVRTTDGVEVLEGRGLEADAGILWMRTPPAGAVEIEYDAGYGASPAVPSALRQAVLLLCAAFHAGGDDAPALQAARLLLAPFERVRL
jgi:uncharacterized phiE125 gp8 family phage protein